MTCIAGNRRKIKVTLANGDMRSQIGNCPITNTQLGTYLSKNNAKLFGTSRVFTNSLKFD